MAKRESLHHKQWSGHCYLHFEDGFKKVWITPFPCYICLYTVLRELIITRLNVCTKDEYSFLQLKEDPKRLSSLHTSTPPNPPLQNSWFMWMKDNNPLTLSCHLEHFMHCGNFWNKKTKNYQTSQMNMHSCTWNKCTLYSYNTHAPPHPPPPHTHKHIHPPPTHTHTQSVGHAPKARWIYLRDLPEEICWGDTSCFQRIAELAPAVWSWSVNTIKQTLTLDRLKKIQNNAAHVVFKSLKHGHVSPSS